MVERILLVVNRSSGTGYGEDIVAGLQSVLLDYCGFDGFHAAVESGRDAINHVLAASPRPVL